MYMKDNNLSLTFLDSLNFLPFPLKRLPDCLGLSDVKKGDFPHRWNRKENFDKVFDKHPPPSAYFMDSMSPKAREEFLEWYDSVKDHEFNFQEQILDYIRADVSVLREAVIKFRDLMMDVTSFNGDPVDPFAYCTIGG